MSLIDTSGCSGGRCSVLKRACQAHHCTFPASNNSVCALSPLLRPNPNPALPQPRPASMGLKGPSTIIFPALSSLINSPEGSHSRRRRRVPLGTPRGSVGPSGPCSWYRGSQTAESAQLPRSALRAAVGVRMRGRGTGYIRGLELGAGSPPTPHSPLLLRPPSLLGTSPH